MRTPLAFLKFAAKAALNAVGGGVAGDFAVEVVPDLATDIWTWWSQGRNEAQMRAELEAVAQLSPVEAQQGAEQLVAQEMADRPEGVRKAVTGYLAQVPSAIRQSQRRPADPSGRTVARGISLRTPEDLLLFLPARLPRFQPGDHPPGIGDWVLEELLGVGDFGEVWKARNPHFDGVPPVALKFCLDPAAKDRLLRHEAGVLNQVMRQGRHRGIVPLQHTYLNADPPCLEYEYVAGGELGGLINEYRSKGGLPPRQAARVVQYLAETVGFAHKLAPPIVHRDLKPANILVQRSADKKVHLRIADFGIGGLAASQALVQTRQGTTRGQLMASTVRGSYTPLYASPQQMRGDPPDPRDDVYSLGVIWYQLLTGDLGAGRPGGRAWRNRLSDSGFTVPLG
jgi:hypothetical protein